MTSPVTPHLPAAPPSELVLVKLPPSKPGERFVEWIKFYGIKALAKRLGVNRCTPQIWKNPGPYRHPPRIEIARLLIAMSHDTPPQDGKGPLSFEDIYGAVVPKIEKVQRARN